MGKALARRRTTTAARNGPEAVETARPRDNSPGRAPVVPLQPLNSEAIFADFRPYQPAENEEYMNEAQRAHFRLVLSTWRQKLIEEVDNIAAELSQGPTDVADESDRATREEQFAIMLRTRDRERRLVQKINDALFRIQNDSFGFCENCGGEIGVARLDARPTAELCIDCKALEEIREKQGAVVSA